MESLSLDASARSEPSVSRSSSLMGNLSRYDDCVDEETQDLFVVVDDPEKHTSTLEAYVTFRITTKVSDDFHICLKPLITHFWLTANLLLLGNNSNT